MIWRAALGAVLAAWALGVAAHRGGESRLNLTVDAQTVRGEWEIALDDVAPLVGLDAAAVKDASAASAVLAAHPELASLAMARLQLSADGRACAIGPAAPSVITRSPMPALLLRFDARCSDAPRALTVAYRLLFDTDPRHQGLLKLQAGDLIRPAIFTAQSPEQVFTLRDPSAWERAAGDLRSGMAHIWGGFDHLMFLVCLLLPSVLVRGAGGSARLRPVVIDVLRIVTAFTVAHSITLSLAALNILSLPSRFTESVIAASVVLAAALNLFPVPNVRRWQAAFVFGLIHGFGFASALEDMGVSGAGLAATLLAFNLGVEAGQLAVVAVLLPLAYAARNRSWYGPGVIRGGSSVIALIALLWFTERAFDLKFMPVH